MITEFHWLNCGYCTTPGKATYPGFSFKRRRYNAWFGLLKHDKLGWIAFDTSYSDHYTKAVAQWPSRALNLLVPVTVTSNPEEQIKAITGEEDAVKHVIVSHLHADHIGGLKCFKNAKLYMHHDAITQGKETSWHKNLLHGFIRELLPVDWEQCTIELEFKSNNTAATNHLKLPESVPTSDIFSDQSIMAVPLPGHSPGMFGIVFKIKEQQVFLCADGIYHIESLKNRKMGFAQKAIGGNRKANKQTFHFICNWHASHPEMLIMASHCDTAAERYQQLK